MAAASALLDQSAYGGMPAEVAGSAGGLSPPAAVAVAAAVAAAGGGARRMAPGGMNVLLAAGVPPEEVAGPSVGARAAAGIPTSGTDMGNAASASAWITISPVGSGMMDSVEDDSLQVTLSGQAVMDGQSVMGGVLQQDERGHAMGNSATMV